MSRMRKRLFALMALAYLGVAISWIAFRWLRSPLGHAVFILGGFICAIGLGAMVRREK